MFMNILRADIEFGRANWGLSVLMLSISVAVVLLSVISSF